MEKELINIFSASLGRANVLLPRLGCWESTLITPHTGHPKRWGLGHDDRQREDFDPMRAAWAQPFLNNFVSRWPLSDPDRTDTLF